jgi:hypothetical protein
MNVLMKSSKKYHYSATIMCLCVKKENAKISQLHLRISVMVYIKTLAKNREHTDKFSVLKNKHR